MEKQKKAFEELKKRFMQELVLIAQDLDKKNENESRYVGLYYGESAINRRKRWKIEASHISLQVLK